MTRIILISLLLIPISAFAATTTAPPKQQLTQINQQINSLQQTISDARNKQTQIRSQLPETESAIGKISMSLSQLNTKIQQQNNQLQTLQQQAMTQQNQIQQQSQALLQQIRANYMMGQAEYFKMLLNQQDPAEFNRMQIYYRYFNTARSNLINELQQSLNLLQATQQQVQQQIQALQQSRSEQAHDRKQLQVQQQQRQNLISQLNNQIKTKNQKLNELLENKRDLENVLQKLAVAAAAAAHNKSLPQFIPTTNGNLWPTVGKIINRFGDTIAGTPLKWNGDLIKAPEGQAIRSIANGRVVFANWLRGFGLLLIVDHGNGYLSLYARNQSLYKQVGDLVRANELIATVGKSGGFNSPGLYFEVRRDGKPIDPASWLKPRK